jgi:hypothetical protein
VEPPRSEAKLFGFFSVLPFGFTALLRASILDVTVAGRSCLRPAGRR